MIKALKLIWDFGRPHTLIGSTLSITTLYLLATGLSRFGDHLSTYLITLVSALACNIFITGLNQIIDVDMDKINKPFLPIAAGRLSIKSAYRIIWIALAVCLLTAIWVDWRLMAIMVLIILIGVAYSVPPIRLKRHHIPASLSIVLVRGLIVNLGIGYFFEWYINGETRTDIVLIPLTIFMMAFSFSIAWFKDLYDVEGDQAFEVKTLAVLYSIPFAFKMGNLMIVLAYLFNIVYVWKQDVVNGELLIYGHLFLLLAYITLMIKSSIASREGVYRFYMSIWVFFFADYLLYIGYGVMV